MIARNVGLKVVFRSSAWNRLTATGLALAVSALLVSPASAQVDYWWTGSSSASWATLNNWSTTNTSEIPPTSGPTATWEVIFGTGTPTPTNLTTTLDATTTVESLDFTTTDEVSISSGTIDPTATLTLRDSEGGYGIELAGGAGAVTINAPIILGATQDWTNDSSNTLTINGGVGGSGYGITANGTGAIVLTGTNTFTGVISVSIGTLQLDSGATLSGSNTLALTSNGTFILGSGGTAGSATFTGLTGSGGGSIQGGSTTNSTLTITAGTATISGVIGGATPNGNNLNLVVNGTANQVVLTGTNTYTGSTTVTTGTLEIGNGTNGSINNSSSITVDTGASLWLNMANGSSYNGNDDVSGTVMGTEASGSSNTLGGSISGAGTVEQYSAGTTILAGSNTFTGVLEVTKGGTLQIGDGATGSFSGNPTVKIYGAQAGNTLALDMANGGTFGGQIIAEADIFPNVVAGLEAVDATNTLTGSISAGLLDFVLEFVQTGPGTTVLASGTNGEIYGMFVQNGALQLNGGTTDSLANNYMVLGGGANSGVFVLGGGGTAGVLTLASLTTSGSGTLNAVEGGASANSTLTITPGPGVTDTFGGSIGDNSITNPNADNLALTVSGPGTLVLTGQNDYTGNTTITAGALEIGGAGTLGGGSYAGNIIISTNETFAYASSANDTLSGVVSGVAGLTQSGSGTLILTGANTYTGATIVTGGTLQVGNGAAGSISSSSTLQLGGVGTFAYDASSGGQTVNGLDLIGGFGTVDVAGGDTLNLGAITNTGAGMVDFETTGVTTTTVPTTNGIIGPYAYVGTGTSLSYATVSGGNIVAYTGATSDATGALGNVTSPTANYSYSGTVNLGTNQTGYTLQNTTSGTSAINLGAYSLSLNGLLNSGSGLLTITGNPGAAGLVTPAGGTLYIADDGNGIAVSADITGTGGLAFGGTGAALLTLSGSNSYTGATTVNDGTVQLIGGSLSPSTTLTLNGGIFELGTNSTAVNTTVAGLNGTGAVEGGSTSISTLTVAPGATDTFAGSIGDNSITNTNADNLALTVSGPGTLDLTGQNDYIGATTITTGTLEIGGTGTLDGGAYAGTIAISANATFDYAGTVNQTLSGVISGAGGLTLSGPGTFQYQGVNVAGGTGALVLTTNDTYTGPTVVDAGTLQVGNGTSGSISSSSTLELGGTGVFTYDGLASTTQTVNGLDVSGGFGTINMTTSNTTLDLNAISVTGNGMVDFSTIGTTTAATTGVTITTTTNTNGILGPNVYTGTTNSLSYATVSNDNIVAYTGATATTNNNMTSATANYTLSGALTLTTNSSGYTLRYTGSGVTTLALGAYSLSLNGLMMAGTQQLDITDSAGSAGLVTPTGGTLDIADDSQTVDISANITGSGGLAWGGPGAGLLMLSGTDSYTGGTTVDNGTIELTSGGSLNPAGSLTVNAGGTFESVGISVTVAGLYGSGSVQGDSNTILTLTVNTGTNDTFDGTIGSPAMVNGNGNNGNLAVSGAGTALDLTGVNTYVGTTTIGTNTTLEIGGSGQLSSLNAPGDYAGAIAISSNGLFNYASSTNDTLTGVISGAGALTQSGSGTLTLTGADTFTGSTTVSAGNLIIGSAGSLSGSAVSINGGTLNVQGAVTGPVALSAGTLSGIGTIGALTVTGGAINLQDGVTHALSASSLTFTSGDSTISIDVGSGTTSDLINFSGAAAISGGAAFTVNINGLSGATTGTTYTFIDATSGNLTADDFTAGTLSGVFSSTDTLTFAVTGGDVVTVTVTTSTPPAVGYWTGTTSASWQTAANFSTTNTPYTPAGSTPTSITDVVFAANGAVGTNTVLGTNTVINSLTFSSTNSFSVGNAPNTLTLEAATTTSNGGNNTAPNGITVNSGAGADSISANVVLGTNQTWTNNSVNTLTISGQVSDTNGVTTLTTAGSGTIALTTNNTYGGGTIIDSGTLQVGAAQALGTGSNVTLSGSSTNAVLDYNVSGGGTLAQAITVSNGDNGEIDNSSGGVLDLTGGISKNGSVLTLSGGEFVVSGVISGNSNNSDVVIGTNTYGGGGAATVGLTTTNTYNGPTDINDGSTLLTGTNNALPNAPASDVTFGSATDNNVTNTLDLLGTSETVASLDVGSTSTNVINQVISSASTVNGSNITLNGGESGAQGILTVNTTTNDSFSGSLGGSGSAANFALVKSGTGVLTLSGVNTYTGGTTINGGGLDVTGSTVSSAVTVNGGTLSGSGNVGDVTLNAGGTIAPGSTPNIQSTLGASANNVLTGASLTINGGTLSYNLYSETPNTGADGSIAGSTLIDLGPTGDLTFSNSLSSSNQLVFDFNNTGIGGNGTVVDNTLSGTPNVYNLIDFGSGLTETQLTTDLDDGDIDIENLGSGQNYSGLLVVTTNDDGGYILQLDVVPEPSAWAMFALGLGLLAVWRRRRCFRRKRQPSVVAVK